MFTTPGTSTPANLTTGARQPLPRPGPRDRPASPTTSPPGRSSPGMRPPGSMTGGAGWRRSGSAGWSAWPRPASVWAARRSRRQRSGPESSPRLRPTVKPGTSSS